MHKITLVFPIAAAAFILLVFSEAVPLMREPLMVPESDRNMTGKDRALCLLITLLYALTAFIGLGSTTGIESFCKFGGQGEYALIEFPDGVNISAVRCYHGLFMGKYNLEFSADGVDYQSVALVEQGHADIFKWLDAELSEEWGKPVRFLRMTAGGRLWLGELAVYDDSGELVSTDAMIIPKGCAALFDEQEKVPAEDSFMTSSYFDEIYHARTAYEHIENITPYEITHPPLGKLLLSVGIRLFGLVPFGWRFMGTLFGVAMLPAIYLFLKKMSGGTLVPACCTAVLATDFMHFSQTRIATIDTYEVLFIILMYGFFWGFWHADRTRRERWLPPLALSGICFGLGAATKWTGFYAGGGLAVLWLIDRIDRGIHQCRAGKGSDFVQETAELVGWSLLFFVLIPACIYYVSYWPYGTSHGLGGGLKMLFSKDYLDIVLSNQTYMLHYHSGVTATHPYSSVWWQWILDIRPILYYLHYFPDGTEQSIAAWLNPMLCWGGLCAMLCMLWLTVFRHDKTALFILVGYLAQLLPWVFVSRIVFEYHYFPSSVFLVLALGHMFRIVELRHRRPRRVVISFTAVSVALFAAFYPALSGARVARWYDLSFLKWMETWPF